MDENEITATWPRSKKIALCLGLLFGSPALGFAAYEGVNLLREAEARHVAEQARIVDGPHECPVIDMYSYAVLLVRCNGTQKEVPDPLNVIHWSLSYNKGPLQCATKASGRFECDPRPFLQMR